MNSSKNVYKMMQPTNLKKSMKYFITLLVIVFNLTMSSAFSITADETVKFYQAEKNKIEELENKAQYHGDDEQVRNRLNLPPKLPSYEDWIKLNIDSIKAKQSQAVVETKPVEVQPQVSQAVVETKPVEVQPQVQENSSTKTDIKSETIKDTSFFSSFNLNSERECRTVTNDKGESYLSCSTTSLEKIIGFSILFLLIALNFISHNYLPKSRLIVLATPFDLLMKKNDSGSSEDGRSNTKRYLYEIFLLSLVLLVCFWNLNTKNVSSQPIFEFVKDFFKLYFVCHFIYISMRMYFALKTRCPKCKSTFASKLTSSYSEPKSTYEKVSNGTSGSRRVEFVKVMETGLNHSDFLCTVCAHEWHTAEQYSRVVSSFQRG